MHTAAILEEVSALLKQLDQTANTSSANGDGSFQGQGTLKGVVDVLQGQQPTVLFCGDLNSDLNDGVPGECPFTMIQK